MIEGSHHGSASTYHRLIQCSYWARLDVEQFRRENKAGDLGTETHSYVECSLAGLEVASMFFTDEATRIGNQVLQWLDEAGRPDHVESAIIYDTVKDAARDPLPREDGQARAHRDYGPFSPLEMPGTSDYVWVFDDHVVIRDLKTGKKENAHREQLVVQALQATRRYGKLFAKVGFLFGRKTKVEAPKLETIGPDELEAASWEMASTLRRLPMAQPTPGEACWFCPARPACPAHQEPTEEERKSA